MEYYIYVNGEKITVTEAVYKEYCRGERKERYFTEGDIHNQVFSYDALDTEELNGSDMFADLHTKTVEDQVEQKLLKESLKKAMQQLNPAERELVKRLY